MSNTRITVVTGAGSGIGEATAQLLVGQGIRVLMVGRTEARLREAQERIGSNLTHVLPVDVAAEGAAEQIVRTAVEKWGRIDTLVNNAGINRAGDFASSPLADFDETISVNVRAPYALTQAAVPHMPSGSAVVFVGSNLTRLGKPGAAAYSASKAAVESLAKTLAVELGSAGIRFNAVSPGLTRTDMTAANFDDAARHEMLVGMSPVGFLGEPSDIAHAIAFLASDAARYINGTSVVIDGGRTYK